ncbi:unnamed protein product [Fusarium langsethiae]|nr:unnamed protein product [Fusarium langsethiae]
MNKSLLALALVSTANAAWIPIGHGPSSEDVAVPTGTQSIALPIYTFPTESVPTGTVPFVPPVYTFSTESLPTGTVPFVPPIYTFPTKSVPTIKVPVQSTKTQEAPVPTFTSVIHVPGPCPTGECHPSYTTKTVLVPTGAPRPTAPSGCSPACPSLCPPARLPIPIPSHPHRPVPVPTGHEHPGYHNTTYPNPRPIDGRRKGLRLQLEADDKTENCTIIRNPGSHAATESWTNVPCNDKSDLTVSWGYVTEPAPAFAVITVNKGKILAWFGAADINGQKVTPSSPFGSGYYGNLGPEQVYTY